LIINSNGYGLIWEFKPRLSPQKNKTAMPQIMENLLTQESSLV